MDASVKIPGSIHVCLNKINVSRKLGTYHEALLLLLYYSSTVIPSRILSFGRLFGSIFFSTHVLEVAEKLCDKVAIIKGGKLIASGTMEEIKGKATLEEAFLELEE